MNPDQNSTTENSENRKPFRPASFGSLLIFLATIMGFIVQFLEVLIPYFSNNENFAKAAPTLTRLAVMGVVLGGYHLWKIYLGYLRFEAEPNMVLLSFAGWAYTGWEVLLRSLMVFLVLLAAFRVLPIFELLSKLAKYPNIIVPSWSFPKWLNLLIPYLKELYYIMNKQELKTPIFSAMLALLFLVSITWTTLAIRRRNIDLNNPDAISNNMLILWIGTDTIACIFWALCFFIAGGLLEEFVGTIGILAPFTAIVYSAFIIIRRLTRSL